MTHRSPSAVTVGLAALGLLALAGDARAWGQLGHRVTAAIARERLSPEARAEVIALIGTTSLAAVSTWPDEVRRARPDTGPWHFVEFPLEADEPEVDVVATPGNVAWAIETQLALLRDRGAAPEVRREALAWVVHLVADVHQPLHCGAADDRGGLGRRVLWRGRRLSLHVVWDTSLPELLGADAEVVARDLAQRLRRPPRLQVAPGGTRAWMLEAHRLARDVVYALPPAPSPDALPELAGDPSAPEVSGAYALRARAVVEQQLLAAGVRLARVLNEALGRSD